MYNKYARTWSTWLRVARVKDKDALLDLKFPKDFEIRQVRSTGKTYVFTKGATGSWDDLTSRDGTGAWIFQKEANTLRTFDVLSDMDGKQFVEGEMIQISYSPDGSSADARMYTISTGNFVGWYSITQADGSVIYANPIGNDIYTFEVPYTGDGIGNVYSTIAEYQSGDYDLPLDYKYYRLRRATWSTDKVVIHWDWWSKTIEANDADWHEFRRIDDTKLEYLGTPFVAWKTENDAVIVNNSNYSVNIPDGGLWYKVWYASSFSYATPTLLIPSGSSWDSTLSPGSTINGRNARITNPWSYDVARIGTTYYLRDTGYKAVTSSLSVADFVPWVNDTLPDKNWTVKPDYIRTATGLYTRYNNLAWWADATTRVAIPPNRNYTLTGWFYSANAWAWWFNPSFMWLRLNNWVVIDVDWLTQAPTVWDNQYRGVTWWARRKKFDYTSTAILTGESIDGKPIYKKRLKNDASLVSGTVIHWPVSRVLSLKWEVWVNNNAAIPPKFANNGAQSMRYYRTSIGVIIEHNWWVSVQWYDLILEYTEA